MGGKYDNKEGNSNCEHLFSRFWEIRKGVTLRRINYGG